MKGLLRKTLGNARNAFEPFWMYRKRRAKWAALVAQKLLGTYAHVSSRVLTLPMAGVDPKTDWLIVDAKIRDVTEVKQPIGRNKWGQPTAFNYVRVGREKGTTFRHWTKEHFPNMKRRERRVRFDWRDSAPAAA